MNQIRSRRATGPGVSFARFCCRATIFAAVNSIYCESVRGESETSLADHVWSQKQWLYEHALTQVVFARSLVSFLFSQFIWSSCFEFALYVLRCVKKIPESFKNVQNIK
jgi:hypothetical protein